MSLKLYLISCEFVTNGDYASFREKLRTMEATEVLGHQWALRTRYSAAEIGALSFNGPPPDAGELSRKWKSILNQAWRDIKRAKVVNFLDHLRAQNGGAHG